MRNSLAAAVAAVVMILGCADESESAATTSVTSVPTESFGCGAAQKTVKSGAPKSSSLGIALDGNDLTQTFTWGSKFIVKFDAVSTSADVLAWHIADYTGKVHASGSIAVSEGTTTANVTCSSTISGYFAVYAKLNKSGATEPHQGSRPAGYVAFGVLPNVEDYVPDFNASLDTRRVGLVGAQDVEPGTGLEPVNENLGTSWIMTSRAMSLTEPQRAGQYNPATYQIDPSIKEGHLARVVYMNGLPLWASTAPSADAIGSYPPKSFSAFQSYSALVGEESARIHKQYIPNQHKNYYQVTWEPDPGPSTEWKGTDAQFVELYKSVWEGVHSTDPDAAVMGPTTQSLSVCASWLERLAPRMGQVSRCGVLPWLLHRRRELRPAAGGGKFAGQGAGAARDHDELMPAGTKLFVTETGIGYPMGSHYSATFPTAAVLTEHAEAVVRTHLIMLGEGVDTSFVFYSADFMQHCGFGVYFNLDVDHQRGLRPHPAEADRHGGRGGHEADRRVPEPRSAHQYACPADTATRSYSPTARMS